MPAREVSRCLSTFLEFDEAGHARPIRGPQAAEFSALGQMERHLVRGSEGRR